MVALRAIRLRRLLYTVYLDGLLMCYTPKISKHGRALDYHDAHNGRQVYSRIREGVND